MKTLKKAFYLNLIIFGLEAFPAIWMMSGIGTGMLSASKFNMFKYFTVDSNILMGLSSLLAAIDQKKVLDQKKKQVPAITYIFKLIGTVGVTLTMLVTVFFLGPTMGRTNGFFSLFQGPNFFFHFVDPVLSLIVFLRFEKSRKITFHHTFASLIPLAVYGIFYVSQVFLHLTNGAINKTYDFYGLFFAGPKSVFIVLPVIALIAWLISCTLWKLNRRNVKG